MARPIKKILDTGGMRYLFDKSNDMRYLYNMKRYISGLIDYVDTLQSEGQYWFLRSQALEVLGVSADAFKLAAYRLAKKGRIKRIHAEFFVIVPLEYQSVGCLPASWFIDDLLKYCQADYYVGLLSAAAIYGAAHQQPMAFQVMSNRRLQSKVAGQLRLEYHYKKTIKAIHSQQIKTETGYMQVSTSEVTLCDIVRYMDAAGQIHNVATVIDEMAEQVSISNIIALIKGADVEIATIQRLGYLMEYLNFSVDLAPLQQVIKDNQPHYRSLVTGSDAKVLERNKRWRVLVNERVEPDL